MRTLKTLIAALLLTTTAQTANADAGDQYFVGHAVFNFSHGFACKEKKDVAHAVELSVQGTLKDAIASKKIGCTYLPRMVWGPVLTVDYAAGTVKVKFPSGIAYVSTMGDWVLKGE